MKLKGFLIWAFAFFLFAPIAAADWAPAKRLTLSSGDSEYPVIVVDSSGNLHVVFHDNTPGNYEIYYKQSTDGGSTWTASKRLTWTPEPSEFPAIAVDLSGHLHVIWQELLSYANKEIYYRKSTDGGATWTTSRRLTWTSGYSEYPVMAVDSLSHLHVLWRDDTPGNEEVYYKKSEDGGETWTTSRRLTWTSGGSGIPGLAVDPSDNIHVVWEDSTPGNLEIYYKQSTDGGTTWTPSKRLTANSGTSAWPAIVADPSGNLHVVWHDNTPGIREIHYKQSTDGGETWTTSRRITWTSGSSRPAISVDSFGGLHIVWEIPALESVEIYYKKSADGGATWETGLRLTWTSGDSYNPDITVNISGNIHVVWEDYTPGNREIYYKIGS